MENSELIIATAEIIQKEIFSLLDDMKKECDKTVILPDGTTIHAQETTSYRNGMTYVVTCDGKKWEIPTENIKMIK